ncbi:NAD-dependent succinate-semialdehyde dehydrogenase [Gulosibacter chungangensis]|uniref:NAD-dependent succinate-semialdehyde dehydrogenase n=1 Tax=Gulosibacter chungangensis TaxID=979746 RepID=A0A7J5B7J3_9MICO|nr:NAD-dependent succinate-semialdehyde dehydrogenase [Gulosibacter chungangensis]KAB1640970.1 NAD-dependent succinate-semialdehyde dehydrogenase [Gulosibacter chungangensis]
MAGYQVLNPATGKVESEFPRASDAEVREAIDLAHHTYNSWRDTKLEERVAIIKRVAELYRERRGELVEIIAREMGKPVRQGAGEIGISADIFDYYADNAAEFLKEEELTVASGGRAVVRMAPTGVILGIMPWNYPYYQVARFAAPNLLLGNTIVLKHASNCPESAQAIAKIFDDAGLPAGAYVNIYASSSQVPSIIEDPRVQGVSLTGSEPAGRSVAEVAGRNLKKCVLELGGSDPFLVLSTEDVTAAAKIAVGGRMANSGQACNASKRVIVVDEYYDEFLQAYLERMKLFAPGDPLDGGTRFGPLSSAGAVDELVELVEDAVAKGANLLLGGNRIEPDEGDWAEGAWMEPTVLTDITPEMRIYREEAFGPVASIYRVADEVEAIRLANDSPFGLGSSIITNDEEQANRVADQIEAGMVYINSAGESEPDLPFGGVKASGIGRELGRFGMEEFANRKLVRWSN